MKNERISFITQYYYKMKKSNPNYLFRNALKDANILYKKNITTPIANVSAKITKSTKRYNPIMKKSTRKHRKNNKSRKYHNK